MKYKNYTITFRRPWLLDKGWIGNIEGNGIFATTSIHNTKKECEKEAKIMINNKFKYMRSIR